MFWNVKNSSKTCGQVFRAFANAKALLINITVGNVRNDPNYPHLTNRKIHWKLKRQTRKIIATICRNLHYQSHSQQPDLNLPTCEKLSFTLGYVISPSPLPLLGTSIFFSIEWLNYFKNLINFTLIPIFNQILKSFTRICTVSLAYKFLRLNLFIFLWKSHGRIWIRSILFSIPLSSTMWCPREV